MLFERLFHICILLMDSPADDARSWRPPKESAGRPQYGHRRFSEDGSEASSEVLFQYGDHEPCMKAHWMPSKLYHCDDKAKFRRIKSDLGLVGMPLSILLVIVRCPTLELSGNPPA